MDKVKVEKEVLEILEIADRVVEKTGEESFNILSIPFWGNGEKWSKR